MAANPSSLRGSTAAPRKSKASATPAAAGAGTFYDGDTYVVDESYNLLLRRLHASVLRHIEARMQPLDLTAMQWGPLMLLAAGKGNTAAALSRLSEIDTGAMTRMLDRLESKGLIARQRSKEDRRIVYLELTEEGRKAAAAVPHVISEVLNLHLQGFTSEEFTLLMGFLRRMLANGSA
ncbi:MAG: MarR family transcriptional regulator [Gammaproteobacteria bacterium]|nr:MarR family transcriptional regulator [Gammaproteobacteria bacterium]